MKPRPTTACLVLLASGCLQTVVTDFDQPPVVVLQSPLDGATFDEGAAVTFRGRVDDDSRSELLEIAWIDNGNLVLLEGNLATAEGDVVYTTADLPIGPHAISLRAIDPDGLTHEVSVAIEVLDVLEEPVVTIVRPTSVDVAEATVPFPFELFVNDPQDPPEALSAELSSDLDGVVCSLQVDTDGVALCLGALRTPGDHRITFAVTDTDGNTTTRSTLLPVIPAREEPTVTPLQPLTGAAILQGGLTTFLAQLDDRQDAPGDLSAGVQSDLEGVVCRMSVDPTGVASCSRALTVFGDHTLTWFVEDADGNRGTATTTVRVTDASGVDDDGDGFAEVQGDCDDAAATVFPGASELADGLDNDCDGFADEGTTLVDDDGDGFCESAVQPCTDGAQGGDCDDASSLANPAQTDACGDAIDADCDGTANDVGAAGCQNYWPDVDVDGFGALGAAPQCQCGPNGLFSSPNDDDCNDGVATTYPGAPELVDGVDNNCDGRIDDNTILTDDDGDGYCEAASGCVGGIPGGDCNDAVASISPGALEVCNDGLDNDCDLRQSEPGAVGCTGWSIDGDGDGYGDAATTTCLCNQPGPGSVQNAGDCNDANANISPAAAEVADGIDNNCDGRKDEGTARYDDDGDGYCEANCTLQTGQIAAWPPGDCNDANPAQSPGATEACSNGVDDDCDLQQNEGINTIACTVYFNDVDNDGYGGNSSQCQCAPSGVYDTLSAGDCYDSNASAYPGQTGWFTGDRGDGSYDYDCNGSSEKRWDEQSICQTNNFFTQLLCGSPTPGWLGDVPSCGRSDTWVNSCDYIGGTFTGFLSCLLEVNKVPSSSQGRAQSCR